MFAEIKDQFETGTIVRTYFVLGAFGDTITLCDDCANSKEAIGVVGRPATEKAQTYCEICDRDDGANNA